MPLSEETVVEIFLQLFPPRISKRTYTYSDWGDQLTRYDGHIITYDRVGNPLSYNNGSAYTFTWEGRRLKTAVKGTQSFTFSYNDEGIRTSKTVNGVEHIYLVDGSTILSEQWGDHLIVYVYDVNGAPLGMRYRSSSYTANTWDIYWFEKNLQGDIVAVYDNNGTKLVSYSYDAWGNFTTQYVNNGQFTSAAYNPFRYRGYFYDIDLNLYYLNSRYYDSTVGRFISSDSMGYLGANGDINSYNLYVYCNNNPVIYVDPDGNAAFSAIGSLIAYTVHQAIKIVEKMKIDTEKASEVIKEKIKRIINPRPADINDTNNKQLIQFEFSKNPDFNLFTSFYYTNEIIKERGLPDNRTSLGVWYELVGHYIFNKIDVFDVTDSDDTVDIGNYENDHNAWIWESLIKPKAIIPFVK